MKVLVCGGRKFEDVHFLIKFLELVHKRMPITSLVEGGARGADTWAVMWAEKHGIPVTTIYANWTKGINAKKLAGRKRNYKLLKEKPHLVVAFKGGSGTRHMVGIAENEGVPVIRTWRFEFKGEELCMIQ